MDSPKKERLQTYIILYNHSERVEPYNKLYKMELTPIDFGKYVADHFKTKYFKTVNRNEAHCTISDGYNIVYYYGEGHLSTGKEFDIHGEKYIYDFIELSKKYGWQILDKGLNMLIDFDLAGKNSYPEYAAFVENQNQI